MIPIFYFIFFYQFISAAESVSQKRHLNTNSRASPKFNTKLEKDLVTQKHMMAF